MEEIMILKRLAAVALAATMAFGMVACKKETTSTTLPEVRVSESGTVGDFSYTIRECELAKYQQQYFSERGFYIDALEQDDSPEFVFISCGKKDTSGYEIHVQDIKIDSSNNVTITVFEVEPAKGADTEKGEFYPAVEVSLMPWAESVTVVGFDGTVYKEAEM